MKARFVTYLCFLFLFVYFFLVFKTDFHGPDAPIYYAYTASVIEDGDLNAVNNVGNSSLYFPFGIMGVSKTYNLPDYHNHGGVVLWVPFYGYAKFIYLISTKLNLTGLTIYGFDRIARCVMSFSTIIFGLLTIILTYLLCKMFFSNRIAIWSTLIIFFGTPFFHFTLFEIANANIIATLFSILSIWFCIYIIKKKKSYWFLYGLFFSICIVVKLDLWFQLVFIFSIFIMLLLLNKTTWLNGIYFTIGLIPGVVLKTINDYIKYDTFHIGEFGLLNFGDSYLFEQLFSSYRGFLYTSPIFYICLLGFIIIVANLLKTKFKKSEQGLIDVALLILSFYIIIKIIFIGYRYAWGGGTPGARVLLTEFPIFVLLYARTLQARKGFFKYCLFFISIVFILWNLLVISEYMAGVDLSYIVETPKLSVRIRSLKEILVPLFYFKDLNLKLNLCLLPMLVVSGITFYVVMFSRKVQSSFWHIRSHNSDYAFKMLCLFTVYLNISYACITFLNVRNNKKNVEELKENGFFENARILTPREFEKGENAGAMNEMIEYFTLKGDHERAYRIQRYKEEKYGEK